MNKITPQDILKNQNVTPEVAENVDKLCNAVNQLIDKFNISLTVTSGYRSPEYNKDIGGATMSNHMLGLAVDFSDTNGLFWQYCLNNLKLAKQLGLYFEDRRWTPTWVHIQLKAPRSGKRIFVPNSKAAIAPNLWNGLYKEP